MEEAKRVRYYPVNRDRLSIEAGIMEEEDGTSVLSSSSRNTSPSSTGMTICSRLTRHTVTVKLKYEPRCYIYIYIIYGDASHLHFSKREIRGRIRRKKKLIVLMNL